MDFSNSAFRTAPASKVSDDTMSHTNLVMACRWGWSSNPESNSVGANTSTTPATQHPPVSTFNNVRSRRFAPCQGRLYHQLLCSHRVRTDLVEDCGTNCVEPYGGAVGNAFICHECIQHEASKIWDEREAQHNATYPPIEQMTQEQYDQWYSEHRQLEAEFSRDQHIYELDLKTKTRPSNICSALEASKEELDFASELDTLSLSLMTSNSSTVAHQETPSRIRVSLATDPSEQLHWDLNTLALDRGACGIEYSASQPSNGIPNGRQSDPEELWRRPRGPT